MAVLQNQKVLHTSDYSPFSLAGDRFPSLCLLIYNFLNE